MFQLEASFPRPRSVSAKTRALLDIIVEARCLEFNATYNAPLDLDEETGIAVATEAHHAANDVFLDFVLACDARAQLNEDVDDKRHIGWVNVAQRAIRSLSKKGMPVAGRADRIRLFSEADHVDQRQLYDEMAARRVAVDGSELNDTSGLWYAVRVAMGQIVLANTLTEAGPRST